MTMVTKSFEIRGNFDTVTMRDWISHRSAVLGLQISISSLKRTQFHFVQLAT